MDEKIPPKSAPVERFRSVYLLISVILILFSLWIGSKLIFAFGYVLGWQACSG